MDLRGVCGYDHHPARFQANSRVITASDEMLQELVNLKRYYCNQGLAVGGSLLNDEVWI